MADVSKIEWTDSTWNIITGCSMVSAGCSSCYAMRLAGTRLQHHPTRHGLTRATENGPVWTGEVRYNPQWIFQPVQWQRSRKIFVCAHGDLFHEKVPDWQIDNVMAVMMLSPRHTFQVLTKRPERMLEYMASSALYERILKSASFVRDEYPRLTQVGISNPTKIPAPWIWMGTSVENQETADVRIPLLMKVPAAIRYVSYEPALGPVDFLKWLLPAAIRCRSRGAKAPSAETIKAENVMLRAASREMGGHFLDWIIAGGESGPDARPANPEWFRTVRDQCDLTGVPFLLKQWGEWCPGSCADDETVFVSQHGEMANAFVLDSLEPDPSIRWYAMSRRGKKRAGRELDGRTHDDYPDVSKERSRQENRQS